MITLRETRLLSIISVLRTGNPNHDPATGQFTGAGGGHGKHWARRQKRRAKRREEFRKEAHQRIAEQRQAHREEKAEVRKSDRRERRDLKREIRAERKTFRTDARAERREMATEQRKEYRKATPEERDELKESHQTARQDLVKEQRERYATLKSDQREQWQGLKEDQMGNRASIKAEHKENWQRLREDLRSELEDLGIGKPKRRSIERKLVLHQSRVHKASSAESILRHCLRQLGWTREFRRDALTGKQRVELLESIREYGRAWLRHEAEQFTRQYLAAENARSGFEMVAIPGVFRARWVEGPGGYLILEDRPALLIHIGRFFSRAKQFVRELIVAGAAAIFGPAPLTGEDLTEADRAAQEQAQYFDRFADEVKAAPPVVPPARMPEILVMPAPTMTPGEFTARVEQYGSPVFGASQEIARRHYARTGQFDQERSMHEGTDEPCPTCIERLALNWQPIGTLRPIGDSECRHQCHCHFRFRKGSDGREYIIGKGGPIPTVHPSATIVNEEEGVHVIAEPQGGLDEIHVIAEPPGGLKRPFPVAGPPKK